MTCKDCIHYEACLAWAGEIKLNMYRYKFDCSFWENKADFQKKMHGEWYGFGPFACSICDDLSDYTDDYCPHCGARMDGDML